mmetsp:Transcript_10627/g.14764  ORF Transcript_10627/g.14764 Transcript_10627/m.14764 type:complete len:104 (+) Transcript_10627:884-1195(+)
MPQALLQTCYGDASAILSDDNDGEDEPPASIKGRQGREARQMTDLKNKTRIATTELKDASAIETFKSSSSRVASQTSTRIPVDNHEISREGIVRSSSKPHEFI